MPKKDDIKYKIGIDEAGRGPWLGPVSACSLCFNPENMPSKKFLNKINDSKKITEKKREEIYKELINISTGEKPQVFFGVGIVDNFIIDEINIKQANKEAMRRSLAELLRKIDNSKISSVVVDGRDNYKFEELEKDPIYIVGGDGKVVEIGAASIIAKVFRDKLMNTYSELYPELGIENHKGYGTKKHKSFLIGKEKITGIHRLSYKPVKKVLDQKPKLLLHICCGPDATVPIIDLKEKYDITCFWYDPNIQPKKEYNKRLKHFKKVCEIENVSYIEGPYDVKNFLREIKGLEHTPEKGEKCTKCYDFRLKETAKLAKEMGIENWTTSLNISPHKDLEKLFKIGEKYSKKEKLNFLKIPFRKNAGFERSVEYTKKYNIYRQNYCGCAFSETYPTNVDNKKIKNDKY